MMRTVLSPDAAPFVPRARSRLTQSAPAPASMSSPSPSPSPQILSPIMQPLIAPSITRRALSVIRPPQDDSRVSPFQLLLSQTFTSPAQIKETICMLNARIVVLSDVSRSLAVRVPAETRALTALINKITKVDTIIAAAQHALQAYTFSDVIVVRMYTSETPRDDLISLDAHGIKCINVRIPHGQRVENWFSPLVLLLGSRQSPIRKIMICLTHSFKELSPDLLRGSCHGIKITNYTATLDQIHAARGKLFERSTTPLSPPPPPPSPTPPIGSARTPSPPGMERAAIRELLIKLLRDEILYLFAIVMAPRTTSEQFAIDWRIPSNLVVPGPERLEYALAAMLTFIDSLANPFPFNPDIFTPQMLANLRRMRENFTFAPTYAPLTDDEREAVLAHNQTLHDAVAQFQ